MYHSFVKFDFAALVGHNYYLPENKILAIVGEKSNYYKRIMERISCVHSAFVIANNATEGYSTLELPA